MTKRDDGDALLTINDAAEAMKMCARSVRRMIADENDPLPVVKIRGAIRILPADLKRYIASHRQG